MNVMSERNMLLDEKTHPIIIVNEDNIHTLINYLTCASFLSCFALRLRSFSSAFAFSSAWYCSSSSLTRSSSAACNLAILASSSSCCWRRNRMARAAAEMGAAEAGVGEAGLASFFPFFFFFFLSCEGNKIHSGCEICERESEDMCY